MKVCYLKILCPCYND